MSEDNYKGRTRHYELKQIEGLTISKVLTSTGYRDKYFLVFEDQSFIVFEQHDTEQYCYDLVYSQSLDERDLLVLGLLDQAEIDAREREQKRLNDENVRLSKIKQYKQLAKELGPLENL